MCSDKLYRIKQLTPEEEKNSPKLTFCDLIDYGYSVKEILADKEYVKALKDEFSEEI